MEKEDISTGVRTASKEVLISSVKTVFGMTPVIGTALNEIFFECGSRIKAARLERLIEHLSVKIQFIDEAKLDRVYLKSEDFFDIAHNILDKALKAKSNIKHQALANILVDAINHTIDIDESLLDVFIDYVDQLKPIQIKMLLYFKKAEAALEEIGSYSNLYQLYSQDNPAIIIEQDEFRLFCSDLETKALISTGDGLSNFDAQGQYRVLESHKDPTLRVTSVGKELLRYVEDNG